MRISDWSSDVCSSDLVAPWAALRPVDSGRRIAVHLVDQDRPQHHRYAAGEHARDRRIRPAHRPARPPVDAEESRDFGREARNEQIAYQPREPDDADPGADRRTRAGAT